MKVFKHTLSFFTTLLSTSNKKTESKHTVKELDRVSQLLTVLLINVLLGVCIAFALYIKYS